MDKYLQYNLDDFLTDDSFIAYANNSSLADVNTWNTWLSNHPDKAVICTKAKFIINTIQFEEDAISAPTKDKIWSKIHQNMNTNNNKSETHNIGTKTTEPKIHWLRIAIGVAASLLIFMFVAGIWSDKDIINTTSYAETNTVVLPDNSIVELNVDTKLKYNSVAWEKERTLYLSGEAFFKVQKGEKFSVHTDKAIIEVLGTSFNIYDRNNVLDVRCETGKVRVIVQEKLDTIVLTPGQGVKMIDKEINAFNFDFNKKSSWKDGVISFESNTLSFVFNTIERQFNVKIEADKNINKRSFTGQIKLDDLQKALHSICWPMHLNYKVNDKNIVITKQ